MAISLGGFLDAPDYTYPLVEVNKMLSTTQASVTFWGRRVVKMTEGNELVTLDAIAKKIIRVARSTDRSGNMELSERIAGIDITNQMFQFYHITDEQIRRSNFLTKIAVYIRELIYGLEKSQFEKGFLFNGWDGDSCERGFRTYNSTTLIAAFGDPLPAWIGGFESFSDGRCRVGEGQIRHLVQRT